jgi:apolipoprotein N-acyltransferase
MDVPMSDFSAGGARQAPLEVAGQRAGISICFEDAFGEEMIRRLPEATLLVNVSNDAWFSGSIAPAQHLQMARMRALEAGRPLLRATNTGMTALIDARGGLQAEAPPYQVYVLDGKIQPMQGTTPYARIGNWPVVMFIIVILVWVYVIGRRSLPLS